MWVEFETDRVVWNWPHQAIVRNPEDKPVKAVREIETGVQVEPTKVVYRQPDDGDPLVLLFFDRGIRGEVAL